MPSTITSIKKAIGAINKARAESVKYAEQYPQNEKIIPVDRMTDVPARKERESPSRKSISIRSKKGGSKKGGSKKGGSKKRQTFNEVSQIKTF